MKATAASFAPRGPSATPLRVTANAFEPTAPVTSAPAASWVHPLLGEPLPDGPEAAAVLGALFALAGASKLRFPLAQASPWSVHDCAQMDAAHFHVLVVPDVGVRVALCCLNENLYIIMERWVKAATFFVFNCTRLLSPVLAKDPLLLDAYLVGATLRVRDALFQTQLMRGSPYSVRRAAIEKLLSAAAAGPPAALTCELVRSVPLATVAALHELPVASFEHAALQFVAEALPYKLGSNPRLFQWSPRTVVVFRVASRVINVVKSPKAPAVPTTFYELQKMDHAAEKLVVHDWITGDLRRYDGALVCCSWNPDGKTVVPATHGGASRTYKGGWEALTRADHVCPEDVVAVDKAVRSMGKRTPLTTVAHVVHAIEQLHKPAASTDAAAKE